MDLTGLEPLLRIWRFRSSTSGFADPDVSRDVSVLEEAHRY